MTRRYVGRLAARKEKQEAEREDPGRMAGRNENAASADVARVSMQSPPEIGCGRTTGRQPVTRGQW